MNRIPIALHDIGLVKCAYDHIIVCNKISKFSQRLSTGNKVKGQRFSPSHINV